MCLNKICTGVLIDKHLSDPFPEKETVYRYYFSTLL